MYIYNIKAVSIMTFVFLILYTICLSYDFGIIINNKEDFGFKYISGIAVDGININGSYDLYSDGFKTSENIILSKIKDIFNINYNISDFQITAPMVYPLIYQSIIRAKYIRNRNESISRDITTIIDGKFDGVLDAGKMSSIRSSMNDIDEILVRKISELNNVDYNSLLRVYRMIPVNHEIGHVYFKVENYNRYHHSQGDKLSTLSEYTAEYISVISTYADLLINGEMDNKDAAFNAITSLFCMIRFETIAGEHVGTAVIVAMMLDETTSRIFKRIALELAKTMSSDGRKSILSGVARNILFETQRAIPSKYISTMMRLGSDYEYNNNSKISEILSKRVLKDIHLMAMLGSDRLKTDR